LKIISSTAQEEARKKRVDRAHVAGEWDRDNSGMKEDRARICKDIMESIDALVPFIEELAETY
jgi:hypothetical protein